MAYRQTIKCARCQTVTSVMVSPQSHPKYCNPCNLRVTKAKRKTHFDTLDKLPIEVRLRRLEEAQYDRPPSQYRGPVKLGSS